MTPPLPFDTLYTIFSLLPTPGMLYREDRRLYDAMDFVSLPLPLTRTKDVVSCAKVCRAWNPPTRRFLYSNIRVFSHAQCTRLVELTADHTIGREVRALEFINGIRRPDSQTLKADITPADIVALVKNCRRLKTLALFGCALSQQAVEELQSDASFDDLITLGLSRQVCPLSLQTTKGLLDRMPKLRVLACPTLHWPLTFDDLPPAPTNRLSALLTHQDSLYSDWLLAASADTLISLDPEFRTSEGAASVKKALASVGRSVRRVRLSSAPSVTRLIPSCPNLRHLTFPGLDVDLAPLLVCIVAPLESLTLFSDHYIGGKAKATLSASNVRTLADAIETQYSLRRLKSLDLSLTYDEVAYPCAPANEFKYLKEVCARRRIQFPCPEVARLISGPNGTNPRFYGDTREFEDTWT